MAAIGLALVAASSAAQAQAISDDIVKIGVLTDMSSLYADATGRGSLAAIKMAVEDYGGRVKGKPVDVVFADHQNRPDLSISIARNWYDNEKVDAIFEVPTSSVALPISTLTREENRNPHQFRRRLFGYHRRRLLAEHGALDWTYDTYALSTVAGSRDRGRRQAPRATIYDIDIVRWWARRCCALAHLDPDRRLQATPSNPESMDWIASSPRNVEAGGPSGFAHAHPLAAKCPRT